MKGPQDSGRVRMQDVVVISTPNGQVHDWVDYKRVTLSRCFNSVIPEILARSGDTLTHLTFSDYTLFKNMKRCLKNLPNLKSLHFSDVIIDAYHRFLYTKIIEVPNLSSLTISRRTKLTNSEYFLMDFLTRGANLKSLAKFQLVEESADSPSPKANPGNNETDWQASILLNDASSDHETPILAKFLSKHHATLKSLNISGTHVKVCTPKTKDHVVQNLALLELEAFHYHMNDPGLHEILTNQKKLKSLKCFIDTNGTLTPQQQPVFQPIYDCIKENRATLTSVQIACNINKSELMDEIHFHHFDCGVLENCEKLRSFRLTSNKIVVGEDYCPGENNNNIVSSVPSTQVLTTKLLKFTSLPPSLGYLTLQNIKLDNTELQEFFEQLAKYDQLKTIKLEAADSLLFKASWLKDLCQLPKIQNISIKGACMEMAQEVQDYIQNLGNQINISFDGLDSSQSY